MAAPISAASSAQFLIRDLIFIFKPFKLKTEGNDGPPTKGLDFIVKPCCVGIALHGPDNYALFAVELIVRCYHPHQISYLHHTYRIAQEGARVKNCFSMGS